MHTRQFVTSGKSIFKAQKALIMLHDQGTSAYSILGLAPELNVSDYAIIAPQATNHIWYPHSFLAPRQENEPWLSSAMLLLENLVADINQAGISRDNIYFAGFAQGACLALEFVARHAHLWGGVAAFTGGLVGDKIAPGNYRGDLAQTPIFIGSSDPDPQVPVQRVKQSAAILQQMNAAVTCRIFPRIGHSIIPQEIELTNVLLFK